MDYFVVLKKSLLTITTEVFMVRNSTFGDCVLIVEGKRGWVMFEMVPLAHNNILISTATQCYLLNKVAIAGL